MSVWGLKEVPHQLVLQRVLRGSLFLSINNYEESSLTMALQSTNNSQVPADFYTGIENRNFLSPIGFRFTIGKMKGVDFFCQAASIPAVNMEAVNQATRFNRVPQPGDELYLSLIHI